MVKPAVGPLAAKHEGRELLGYSTWYLSKESSELVRENSALPLHTEHKCFCPALAVLPNVLRGWEMRPVWFPYLYTCPMRHGLPLNKTGMYQQAREALQPGKEGVKSYPEKMLLI